MLYSVAPVEYVVLAFARGLEGGLDSSKSAHLNTNSLSLLSVKDSVYFLLEYMAVCSLCMTWYLRRG